MDELLALLERYSPGYADQIQGASAWNLRKLKESFGQPLPEFYQEFADVMGKDGGPLLAHVQSYDPYDVTELYEVAWRELPPRRFLFVFGDPSIDAQHYWLDLETPTEDEEYRVFRFAFGKEEWKKHRSPLYMSLREMLFVWAMSNVCLPTFPHRAAYYSRLGRMPPGELLDAEDVARIFERLRFVRLPYPQRCLLFERDDAAIELYRSPDEPGFSFRVGMRNPEELRRFQAIMEDIKGLAKE
ncbi:hypothetical protein ACN28E_52045 [Archangium lansingense]|uniref:hypothetical protein n=1 Tax=Archangium lansingense TaxID=2995310 RepID=UPI003B7B791D